MSIEIYAFPPSPRAFKVMAVANHLDLDWTLHMVDLRKGEQRTPEYGALNPNMRIPTLKDGDYLLWESDAIIHYLAAKRPDSGLLPREEKARLDVMRWQFWNLAHWDATCAILVFEYLAKRIVLGIDEPDMAAIEKGNELFHRNAKVLDHHLRSRAFVTGDSLTLADFSLGCVLNLAEPAHYPLEPYGEIKRWHASLCALPAWQKTLTQSRPPKATAA